MQKKQNSTPIIGQSNSPIKQHLSIAVNLNQATDFQESFQFFNQTDNQSSNSNFDQPKQESQETQYNMNFQTQIIQQLSSIGITHQRANFEVRYFSQLRKKVKKTQIDLLYGLRKKDQIIRIINEFRSIQVCFDQLPEEGYLFAQVKTHSLNFKKQQIQTQFLCLSKYQLEKPIICLFISNGQIQIFQEWRVKQNIKIYFEQDYFKSNKFIFISCYLPLLINQKIKRLGQQVQNLKEDIKFIKQDLKETKETTKAELQRLNSKIQNLQNKFDRMMLVNMKKDLNKIKKLLKSKSPKQKDQLKSQLRFLKSAKQQLQEFLQLFSCQQNLFQKMKGQAMSILQQLNFLISQIFQIMMLFFKQRQNKQLATLVHQLKKILQNFNGVENQLLINRIPFFFGQLVDEFFDLNKELQILKVLKGDSQAHLTFRNLSQCWKFLLEIAKKYQKKNGELPRQQLIFKMKKLSSLLLQQNTELQLMRQQMKKRKQDFKSKQKQIIQSIQQSIAGGWDLDFLIRKIEANREECLKYLPVGFRLIK